MQRILIVLRRSLRQVSNGNRGAINDLRVAITKLDELSLFIKDLAYDHIGGCLIRDCSVCNQIEEEGLTDDKY